MVRKIMVRTDMEGLSGVVNYSQVTLGTPEYHFGQDMLMSELLALIEGLQTAGIDEIVLFDEHATGRNTRMEELPDFVSSINGKPLYTRDWVGGLDSTFDGMMMLGLHGKAGTVGGVLPHTYGSDILDIQLNGVSVGEIGIEAALAGDCDVPTLLIIADSAGVEEAKALLPGIFTVTTKEALAETAARCYAPAGVAKRIREGAIEAVSGAASIAPHTIAGPVRLEVVLADNEFRRKLKAVAPPECVSDGHLIIEAATTTEAWTHYLKWEWLARQ